MKKSALLILAAIFVIGIQSCTIDEQEEIAPQDFSITKGSLEKNNSLILTGCFKTIYIDYGNLDNRNRGEFRDLAAYRWFNNQVIIETTLCPSIEIWKVPCGSLSRYSAKNDEEEEIVIDAEESLTLGEGGAPPPPSVTRTPRYLENRLFPYHACITGIEDPIDDNTEDDNQNPPIITSPDDDNPHNTPGLPIINIR